MAATIKTTQQLLLAISIAMLAACSDPNGKPEGNQSSAGSPPAAPTAPSEAPTPQTGVQLPNFVSLVNQQGAAVVNISSLRLSPQAGARAVPPNHPLHEFFRRFGGAPDEGEAPAAGLGSGFIISPDGYILTNAHVIAESDIVSVKMTNKREYKAKVVGADIYTDVALLKIDAKDLPTVKIGNPNTLQQGEWVAAIGAPFGFENSVTVGVVSAKGRVLPNGSYVPFIQTDVAVNPGNSGGPLFSTGGEVVGINSQIYSQTGGYMGISFAIPIDVAMTIADQLKESGAVTRGRIGVQLQELTFDLATSLGLKEPKGALVAAVQNGGPADTSGIMPGDVVLSVNDQAIQSTADLARLIGQSKPGSTISLQVWRNGKTLLSKVEVAAQSRQ